MTEQSLTETANTRLHLSFLPEAQAVNRRIVAAFRGLNPESYRERSHYFGGRYENIYVDKGRIPELELVLAHAEACAREVLTLGDMPLRCGLWFNDMAPGHSTSEHTHEELDELMSAVYYLDVPEASGDLVLRERWGLTRITPRTGMLVLFPPWLPHWVEPNLSEGRRLSLGINIGPAGEP
jgi:hypothetical protein